MKPLTILGALVIIFANACMFYEPEWLVKGTITTLIFQFLLACCDIFALMYIFSCIPKIERKCKKCNGTGRINNLKGIYNRCDCYYEKHL